VGVLACTGTHAGESGGTLIQKRCILHGFKCLYSTNLTKFLIQNLTKFLMRRLYCPLLLRAHIEQSFTRVCAHACMCLCVCECVCVSHTREIGQNLFCNRQIFRNLAVWDEWRAATLGVDGF